MFKKLKIWWQRRTQGYANEDLYDMNRIIARVTLPMLKAYRNITPVKHATMTEYEWLEALDNMIYTFEVYVKDDDWPNVNFKRLRKGLKQFGENFEYFGW